MHAAATAGMAVLFAGSTVIVAICGLALSGIWAIGVMGFGVAMAVGVTVVAALTLLPALLGLLGRELMTPAEYRQTINMPLREAA